MRRPVILIASAALCGCMPEPQPGNGTTGTGVSTMVENQAVMISSTPFPATPAPATPMPVETPSPVSGETPAFNEQQLTIYPGARGLPGDVQRFVARYEDCEHFIGEPDYDAERRAELDKAVAEVCKGIDAEARALRGKYAADAAVVTALASYEDLRQ